MVVFGIELKASDAIVVVIEKSNDGQCIGKEYKKFHSIVLTKKMLKVSVTYLWR